MIHLNLCHGGLQRERTEKAPNYASLTAIPLIGLKNKQRVQGIPENVFMFVDYIAFCSQLVSVANCPCSGIGRGMQGCGLYRVLIVPMKLIVPTANKCYYDTTGNQKKCQYGSALISMLSELSYSVVRVSAI